MNVAMDFRCKTTLIRAPISHNRHALGFVSKGSDELGASCFQMNYTEIYTVYSSLLVTAEHQGTDKITKPVTYSSVPKACCM